ncbi:hypothetical protein E4U42_000045 [Claviceps africana]|uniref:Uncharacterized protein n=1 Tax=Claviceps africana TaxID=83212 RepID=A0A8K0JD25_9HYPO|nr:hypothetical protein E4U42_000045 [Claviceps africana]
MSSMINCACMNYELELVLGAKGQLAPASKVLEPHLVQPVAACHVSASDRLQTDCGDGTMMGG